MQVGKDDVDMTDFVNPVIKVTRKHFEEGFAFARISVTQTDLAKFDAFKAKMDPNAQAKKEGGAPTINWPAYQES